MQRLYARRLIIATLALILLLVLVFSVWQGGLPF
jgi:hypothetical protein